MSDISKVKETNYERKMREEYSCYNEELDLWDSTKLDKLNREDECRRMMEKMRI
jgi:hypothetical protein